MAFPNSSLTDLVITTLANRSPKIQDNTSKNNAVLAKLSMKGKVKPFSGGRTIYEPFTFGRNTNGTFYSGYDLLSVAAQDVISGASFNIKQYAVPVVISGLEELQNSGEYEVFDLMAARMEQAEQSMKNDISQGIYSDGTGFGGKTITGLDAAVPQDPTTGTYGGIDRSNATWAFWRSQLQDPGSTPTSTTIQGYMNLLWAATVRGADRPDLIMSGTTIWSTYMASLQAIQRFTDSKVGNLGFPSVKFMDADVILDGGIGGYATATDMYFLNTDYLYWRPHRDRNMVPLDPSRRVAVNQDATVAILAFAGNLTCSGAQFQGRLKGD